MIDFFFRQMGSQGPTLLKHSVRGIFCCCTARFVSDLVGNPEDRISQDAAQIIFSVNDNFSTETILGMTFERISIVSPNWSYKLS